MQGLKQFAAGLGLVAVVWLLTYVVIGGAVAMLADAALILRGI